MFRLAENWVSERQPPVGWQDVADADPAVTVRGLFGARFGGWHLNLELYPTPKEEGEGERTCFD